MLLVFSLAATAGKTLPVNRVKQIELYFIPLSSFTRLAIDSSNIKAYNSLALTVRNPRRFLKRMNQAVKDQAIDNDRKFGFTSVRILYVISYTTGSTERMLVDTGRSLLWNQNLYYANDKTLATLLSPLSRQQLEALGEETGR